MPKDFSHFFPVRWCKSTRQLAAGIRCGRQRCVVKRGLGDPRAQWAMENHGKIMGKSWENHGKIMGKSWEHPPKIDDFDRKIIYKWGGAFQPCLMTRGYFAIVTSFGNSHGILFSLFFLGGTWKVHSRERGHSSEMGHQWIQEIAREGL